MPRDEGLQPGTPRPELGGGEFLSPGGRGIHEVGDSYATRHQVCPVLVGHGFTSVKVTIDDAGQSQRRNARRPDPPRLRVSNRNLRTGGISAASLLP